MTAHALSSPVSRDELPRRAADLLAAGWRLALVAVREESDSFTVSYAFLRPVAERVELTVDIPRDDPWLPTLAAVSYPASRFEREVRDLYGIRPEGHPLPFRLVRHAHWPTGWYPMLRDAAAAPPFEPDTGSYPFLEVEGDGVYEIPVGPVHAGLIEPGHFRFSVVGETILRMKARLWFLHRGVERLFRGRRPEDGIELAERISGDTAVGHTLAYVMAVEQAAGVTVPVAALRTRALLLELERMYNHVGDLGAIANDVGFGVANAHAQRLRELLLRHNKAVTGHRLLRGGVTIGGAGLAGAPDLDLIDRVAAQAAEVVAICLDNSVVLDRFTGTAVLPRPQAVQLDTVGYVARASGVDVDARRDHPMIDLGDSFAVVTHDGGDVLARFLVRAGELAESAALVRALASGAPVGTAPRPGDAGSAIAGLGVVEGWRGTLVHRVEIGPDGRVSGVKVVDPSFLNWPALPVALADTIVPDFPLANKSFNQSYAGNDL